MLATLFLTGLCTAIILTPIGFLRKSWIELAVAAGLAMVAVVLSIFTIGTIIFALTCLDLFTAVAFRLNAGWRGWLLAMLGAGLVWGSLAALPRLAPDGEPWHSLATTIPLASVLAAVVLLIAGRGDQRTLSPTS